jgi:hypothetical protein
MESKPLDDSDAFCPDSKILFVSQESSDDLVGEALSTGARGDVVKANANGC